MLLAFIDSAGIPVSVGMDALIILMGVRAPGTVWFAATLAVLGSLAGNLLLFLGARKGGERFVKGPASPGNPQRFRGWFARYGLITVFLPALLPFPPLPLKVFVVTAGIFRAPLRSFVAVIVAARAIRYYGEAYLGVKLGKESLTFLKQNAWPLAAAVAGLCVLSYFLLRWNDRYLRSR
jgi:membrane protein YqaA with SNARE-associated domain